ncbi:MAG: alpha/beta hydrolase [Salinisphaera sp.]|nr:alpha/beta hydrolase [Salinisphaera sp.]
MSDDWRQMSRAQLDAAYDNGGAVAGSAGITADWTARSEILRAERQGDYNVPYGSAPRECFDFLPADKPGPVLVFVHGGYWQMRSKEDFTFVARGALAHGVSVAVVGYTLAPQASIGEMVAECSLAVDYLVDSYLIDAYRDQPLWLAGWSAGAHLVTSILDHPSVDGALAISGIYDLAPIRYTYVNDKLRLTADSASRYSPSNNRPTQSSPILLSAGAGELAEMRRQTREFSALRRGWELPGDYRELANTDHFTVLESFAAPDGELMTQLMRWMRT